MISQAAAAVVASSDIGVSLKWGMTALAVAKIQLNSLKRLQVPASRRDSLRRVICATGVYSHERRRSHLRRRPRVRPVAPVQGLKIDPQSIGGSFGRRRFSRRIGCALYSELLLFSWVLVQPRSQRPADREIQRANSRSQPSSRACLDALPYRRAGRAERIRLRVFDTH
jgi:hypothetical protein